MDHVAIHHAKGCAYCHEYIKHLLGAQRLGQINLLHSDIENTVKSTWPGFINSIEIDADERVQRQISDLHVWIDEMKDALHDTKKSSRNTEVVLTKECSQVKDLEQELKDFKSHLQVTANTSMVSPTTVVAAEPPMQTTQVAKPAWSLPQPETGPSQLPPPPHEVGPSTQPEGVSLGCCITMEMDEGVPYQLMEEEGFKPSDNWPTVLKRQQHRGLGPPVNISSFNSMEELKRNYLA